MSAERDIHALTHDAEIRPLLFEKRMNGDAEIEAPRCYLKPYQREEKERDIRELRSVLDDPIARKGIQNPGRIAERIRAQEKDIASQLPPPTTPGQRDKLARLESVLAAHIAEGMPTREEMRAKDVDTVDRHTEWSQTKTTAVLIWKAVRRLLNPGSDRMDLANVERLRSRTLDSRDLRLNADIPGLAALSAQAKANYDAIDWKNPETQAEILAQLAAAGVKVNLHAKATPRIKPKPANDRWYECSKCDWRTSGGFGRANLRRHEATHMAVGATA